MPSRQRGSGFVGLNQYLGLNQQAGQRLGEGLAQQVEQEGGAAQGEIDNTANLFRQQAGVGQQYGAIGSSPDAMRNVVQANTVLAGPTALGDTSNLMQRAAGVEQRAQMVGSEAGRQALLGQQYGQGRTYGTGARMLDSALAGRGAGERLQQAGAGFGKLREYLGTAQKSAEGDAAGARQRATEALGAAGTYLNTATPMGTPVVRPPGSTDVPEYLAAPTKKKDPWMNKAGRWMFGG